MMRLSISLTLIILTFLLSTALADEWTFFPASEASKYGCSVNGPVNFQVVGSNSPSEDMWVAEGWVDYHDHPLERQEHDWAHQVARYAFTDKNLGRAIEACKKWEMRAHKLVERAHSR